MADKKEKKFLIDNPKLMSEWNWKKNNELGLDPKALTCGSGKKVWWKCNKGHEWQTTIVNRNKGRGCPYCSNQKVIKGYNDLTTINPKLASEWNYEKNGNLTPDDFTIGSNKKVWWKCSKGHEWQSKIANRNNGRGCPICTSERSTSFPEYAIIYYLIKNNIKAIHRYNDKGYELDIYIPPKKVAIEYDGNFWHKNTAKKELEKNLKCKNDGIKLYRLREGLQSLNDSSIDYVVDRTQKDLDEVLQKVLSKIVGFTIDIDLNRDAVEIENLREYTEKENSLLYTNPNLAKEWNYERNGDLRPEHILTNSGKKVWWKCQRGHEWQANINNRNNGNGCPYCSNQKALKGYNDLTTINPELAKDWNYEKNGGLKPEDFTTGSNKKVWWKCVKGHEWQSTINNRNNGQGCPICASKKLLKGYNDLETLNPKLTNEWNYEKNGDLKPEDFMPNSNKKVWWKCAKGHVWQATIAHRNNGRGCPYCTGKYIIKGESDLATINSKLANEWNYEKNGELKPEDFMPNSNKKVWWKCVNGHEWQATIGDRNNGKGCPYCSNQKVLKGYNDLETVNPKLAREWNYEKNGDLKPEDFTTGSNKKVWWKCKNGHCWEAKIGDRNRGRGCPYCYKEKRKKKNEEVEN